MKKSFTDAMCAQSEKHPEWVFVTGDLGYKALESLQQKMGDRFVNAGIAEQNMVTVSAALAYEGFIPWVYSITPFVTLRPYEQIRNDVCLHNLPVKIIGNGGGYGYGIMGATHHGVEDVGIMRILPNMKVYSPFSDDDVSQAIAQMAVDKNPNYLRLTNPATIKEEIGPFQQWRKVKSGSKAVVVGTGPVLQHIINSEKHNDLEVWLLSVFPIVDLPAELIAAINSSKKLIVVEEHYGECGLRETLSFHLMNNLQSAIKMHSICAKGYPSGKYGNQNFHQKENSLAGDGLTSSLDTFFNQNQ